MATTVVNNKRIIASHTLASHKCPKKRLVIVDEQTIVEVSVVEASVIDEPTVVVEATVVVKATQPMKSIWMQMRRIPKKKHLSIVWENVEDISDDENDTPQAAEERMQWMSKTRDAIRFQYFNRKLDELHYAGLFMNTF